MNNTTEVAKINCYVLGILIAAAEWNESKVSRDESGRFAKSSSSSSTPNSDSSSNFPLKPLKVPYKLDIDIDVEATPSFSEYKKNNTDRVFNNAETYEILADAVSKINWEGKRGKIIKELIKQEMDETIQQAAKKVLESRKAKNLFDSIDPGSSDLASDFAKKAKEKGRSITNLTNGKALLEYISISAGIAVLGSIEKLVEADVGKDIKTFEDIKKEAIKAGKQVLQIENDFIVSQIKGMQKLAERSADKVAEIVSKNLPSNIKDWKEQGAVNNKKQVESLKKLIKKAQEESQKEVENEGEFEDESTIQSMATEKDIKTLGEIFKNMKNLDLEKLCRALQSKNLDSAVEKFLNELLV